jgi:hypothetical protein
MARCALRLGDEWQKDGRKDGWIMLPLFEEEGRGSLMGTCSGSSSSRGDGRDRRAGRIINETPVGQGGIPIPVPHARIPSLYGGASSRRRGGKGKGLGAAECSRSREEDVKRGIWGGNLSAFPQAYTKLVGETNGRVPAGKPSAPTTGRCSGSAILSLTSGSQPLLCEPDEPP